MASMVDVMKFFGYEGPARFRADWAELTDADKDALKLGLTNGTLTY